MLTEVEKENLRKLISAIDSAEHESEERKKAEEKLQKELEQDAYAKIRDLKWDALKQHVAVAEEEAAEMPAQETISSHKKEDLDFAIAAYDAMFKESDGSYKEGAKAPERSPDSKRVLISFPSPEDEAKFVKELAGQNKSFKLSREDGQLLAYSNGDGKLYKPDGTAFGADELIDHNPAPMNDLQPPTATPTSPADVAAVDTSRVTTKAKEALNSEKTGGLVSNDIDQDEPDFDSTLKK